MYLFGHLFRYFVGLIALVMLMWCIWVELPYIEDVHADARNALQSVWSTCEARNDPAANLEAALVFAGGKAVSDATLTKLKTAREAARQARLYPQRATAGEIQKFWTAQEAYWLTVAGIVDLVQKTNIVVQTQFAAVATASEMVTAAASQYNSFALAYNKTLHGPLSSTVAYLAGYKQLPILSTLPPVPL